jgi:nicotinate phosphoribosyltransferase
MTEEAGPGATFTDLYELTMLQAYFNEGMDENAVFDLFVRHLPDCRNFLVAAGLDQVLDYLEGLQFSKEDLDHLATLGVFSARFLKRLSTFRFTGNVRAMPEGTIFFPGEPLLEIEAPIQQAQLVETFVLNQITFQSMIASKAVRAAIAAGGRTLVDFGSRRAHGTDAALKAARALYLAGYDSTSNVLAGKRYGIPVAGTMAHSYVQAHDSEEESFLAFLATYPETVLLVDTYDTAAGVRLAAQAARKLPESRLRGVRLDSGDLVALAREARAILDAEGLQDAGIFASGGLDEYEVHRLLAQGAPIDAFGVGTAAVVSSDAPTLDSVYKLVSYAEAPRLKTSVDKETLPGRKQVFRLLDQAGKMEGDTLGLAEESLPGEPLLVEVMRQGRRTDSGRRTLEDARAFARTELARLPERLLSLEQSARPYPVSLSGSLSGELRRTREAVSKGS